MIVLFPKGTYKVWFVIGVDVFFAGYSLEVAFVEPLCIGKDWGSMGQVSWLSGSQSFGDVL